MEALNKKAHWNKIYSTREINEVSWYQEKPETSILFLNLANIRKNDAIIDIGGGDSFFVDYLLKEGYTNVTILDISETAISRAKLRLGNSASKVNWIVSDINDFNPNNKYDFWHDRAAFHFLNSKEEIIRYRYLLSNSLSERGQLVIGTFSKSGPSRCSGIKITQYDKTKLCELFNNLNFISHLEIDHITPFNTIQNFIFCHLGK